MLTNFMSLLLELTRSFVCGKISYLGSLSLETLPFLKGLNFHLFSPSSLLSFLRGGSKKPTFSAH